MDAKLFPVSGSVLRVSYMVRQISVTNVLMTKKHASLMPPDSVG